MNWCVFFAKYIIKNWRNENTSISTISIKQKFRSNEHYDYSKYLIIPLILIAYVT